MGLELKPVVRVSRKSDVNIYGFYERFSGWSSLKCEKSLEKGSLQNGCTDTSASWPHLVKRWIVLSIG